MFPDTMNAVQIAAPGAADQLRMTTRPVPVPCHDQILIRLAYAGV
ncbi:MAG: NAD(P)H-quinone oxidoreductase, partial [Pararhodobacter sp.]